MGERDAERAELESLRSEWREALLSARAALEAEKGVLEPDELEPHERHLHDEYASAAAGLRRLALDEGLPTELAEPFLPRGRARRALGLPAIVRACVFELDDVLVGSAGLHREAWTRTFDELLAGRSDTTYGRLIAPFEPQTDYPEHVAGRPRLEGVRAFLASRGIRLPEGDPQDPPGAATVHGVANRKHEWLGRLVEQRGVAAFDGVRHYLERARDAGIRCAAVSASAHTAELLERSGLAELVTASTDEPLAACRVLHVEPARTAVFETTEAGVAAARADGFAWIVAIDPAGEPNRLRALRKAGANVAAGGLADLLQRSE